MVRSRRAAKNASPLVAMETAGAGHRKRKAAAAAASSTEPPAAEAEPAAKKSKGSKKRAASTNKENAQEQEDNVEAAVEAKHSVEHTSIQDAEPRQTEEAKASAHAEPSAHTEPGAGTDFEAKGELVNAEGAGAATSAETKADAEAEAVADAEATEETEAAEATEATEATEEVDPQSDPASSPEQQQEQQPQVHHEHQEQEQQQNEQQMQEQELQQSSTPVTTAGADSSSEANLAEIRVSEVLVFDKIKELEEIDESLTDFAGALDHVTREPSSVEGMFAELKSLRTTEAEALLEEAQRAHQAVNKAAEHKLALVEAKLADLLAAGAKQTEEVAALRDDLREAKKQEAKLSADFAKQLDPEAALLSIAEQERLDEAREAEAEMKFKRIEGEVKELTRVIDTYKAMTGLTAEFLREGVLGCTLRNKAKRKILKYELENDDEKLMYRPTGNVQNLPLFLQDEVVITMQELPMLTAHILGDMFTDTRELTAHILGDRITDTREFNSDSDGDASGKNKLNDEEEEEEEEANGEVKGNAAAAPSFASSS